MEYRIGRPARRGAVLLSRTGGGRGVVPSVAWIALAALAVPTVVCRSQAADQPMQYADRGPAFYSAPESGHSSVDVRDAGVFRQRVSLHLREVSIPDALAEITRQTAMHFTYAEDAVPQSARVSLAADNITVAGALNEILIDASLDVELLRSGMVSLVRRGVGASGVRARRVDPRLLTGRVLDAETMAPVPAAIVLVTGTTIGTTTSDSGTFSLRLPDDAKSLTVRRIGFLEKTVPLNGAEHDVTVTLTKDVLRLQTQVVTGVATTVSSRNAANAVAVVDAQQITEVPAPTLENAIQGKVPGAIIQQNNGGAPGGGLQIQIRGITSINANAAPLYVVDGVIVNNETINPGTNAITSASFTNSGPNTEDNGTNRIADLNPEDIESIEVLKGASASAIYGSKASSGVIIITTKKGTQGRPKWEFSQKVGHFSLDNTLPLRTFPTLASAVAWGSQHSYDSSTIASVYAGPQNFQSQLFSNPQASYETDLSVSGEASKTQYYLSLLSKYDNGTMLNTGYNKQSVRANITQTLSNSLSATLNLTYANSLTRRGVSGNDNVGISPYDVFSYTPQFVNLARPNADGAWPVNPFGPANPFADAIEIQTPEEVSRFIGGGTIDWKPFSTEHQSLHVTFIGGADLTSQTDQQYAPPDLQVEYQSPSGLPGVATLQSDQTNYLNYSVNVVYHYTGLSFLDATTSAGFVRDRRSDNNPAEVGQGLLAGLNSPTAGSVVSLYYNADRTLDQSLYGQEQILALNERLSLTAGVTGERSTNDGDIDKFYVYPRFSTSYRIPQFAGFLDELKVRAAYGQSGTLPNYGDKYTPYTPTLIGGVNGFYADTELGNPAIRPETETEIETGFDATLFQSRAQFTFTVYQKRVQNLLLQAAVAPSLLYADEWINGGEFTNQGIELSLSATPVQSRHGVTWISTTSFYRNYSVVNSLPVPAFSQGNTLGLGAAYLEVGRSVSQYVNLNALQPNGEPLQVGDLQPSYRMSFGNELTYHGFRLYGLVDWSRGGNTVNYTNQYFDFGPGLIATQDSAISAQRVALYENGVINPYVEIATFVKLRELTLSYALADRVINRLMKGRVTSARLALTGRNLLAWFRYTGLDPEVSVFGNQQVTRGQDVTPYPPARSYFLSLDLGF